MYNIVRSHVDNRAVNKLIRWYSFVKKSHYEVLRLKRNCSDKDIKEAFIRLSKEYHPDKNKEPDAQQQFVQIVEAYNVLGKASSRANYDSVIRYEEYRPPTSTYSYSDPTYNARNPYNTQYEYTHTKTKARKQRIDDPPYYGVKGIHRVPNYVLIAVCIGVAFVGTLLQIFVIREMYVVNKHQSLERSKLLSEEYDRLRTAAQSTTNEKQTRLMMEKILSSSNPTIATASLGQALASEKK